MAANTDESCVFCLIIGADSLFSLIKQLPIVGKIPSYNVYETERTLAFLDISPVAEGHTQVIPKYHAKTIADLPDEYLADVGPVCKKVALATGAEQYNILQNNGKLAFQVAVNDRKERTLTQVFQHVDHVHFHVIPKPNETEGLVLSVGVNWPQKKVSKEDLEATLEKMKTRL